MPNVFSTAVTALNAFQRGLATTGHNIANVNTEGYSRQTVDLGTREPERRGPLFIGTGVEVDAVHRKYDDLLAGRYRSYTSDSERFGVQSERIALIDNLLADPDSGLEGAFQQFFSAMQDVATDPTAVPTRQVLLNEAEQLTARFASLNAWLNDLDSEVNADLDNFSSEINGLARSIAEVNERIAEATAAGTIPNDLLDTRDQLVDELSGLVKVTTVEQDSGATSVFIGNGVGLVVDNWPSSLRTITDPNALGDPRELQIVSPNGIATSVTAEQLGGKIGGLIAFRDQALYPAQDQLGRLAVGIAEQTNALHAGGMDLNGATTGSDLFSLADPSSSVSTAGGAATVTLSFVNTAALEATEYRLSYTTAGGWAITPANTGVRELLSGSPPFTVDGLEIGIAGTPNDGDVYHLRPFRQAASALGVVLNDPRAVAAADASAGGVGDNSNALAMAQLQQTKTMLGGAATFADTYGELVADIGTRARESRDSATVQSKLAAQAEAALQEVSGVNLDEEAANLVRFQQAYQAAAQVISVANTLFDSLLGAVRR